MKKKRSILRIIDIAIVTVVLLLTIYLLITFHLIGGSGGTFSATGRATVTQWHPLPPIDAEISTTLPYAKYMSLQDSIKFARKRQNGSFGSFFNAVFIGAQTNERFDPHTYKHISDSKKSVIYDRYIMLDWWELELNKYPNPLHYYVKDRQAYLRKTKCNINDEKDRSENYNKMNSCTEYDGKIPYFYNEDQKAMLIPVSNNVYRIMRPVVIIAMILFFLYYTFYIIGGFIKFLTEIAQGTPFSDTNVKRLRSIAVHLFLIPVSLIVLNFLMRLIFHKYFTPEIHLSSDVWGISWKPLILSGIFTALYAAFRRGKQLQDENDFTV